MNETGPDAVPPEDNSSFEERIRERFTPEPEPPLKIIPSSLYQSRIESILSSTARMKHALTCCGADVPTLNQTGRVEAEHLVEEGVGQLVLEDRGVVDGGEVAVHLAGLHVGEHDAVDELLERPLALVGADRAAEVLGRDDVRGVDRPRVGELDPALLEVDRAVTPVGHDDVATLPGHFVVRVHAGLGVDPLDGQPSTPRARYRRAALGVARRFRHPDLLRCHCVQHHHRLPDFPPVRVVLGPDQGCAGSSSDRCCRSCSTR